MFKNTYQSGLLSIFYSCGSNPLAIWDMEVHNGHVKRLTDQEVNSVVLEIVSTNVATTFITCPKKNQVLGIRLPFLVMIVKNLKRYFSFEITILDDKNMRRRFRISNFQSTTKIRPFCTTMPIGLSGGWNQIQFNLADFTRRAYGSQFIETHRVQIHANARLRRIYFSDRLYTEEELPQDYKLYLPLERKLKKKEEVKAAPKAEAGAEGAAPPAEVAMVEEVAEGPPPTAAPSKVKQHVAAKKSAVEVAPEPETAAEEAPPAEGEKEEEAPAPAEGVGEEGADAKKENEEVVEGEAMAEGGEFAAPEEGEPPVEGGEEKPAEGDEGAAPEEVPAPAAEEAEKEGEEAPEAPAEEPAEEAPADAPTEEAAPEGE